MLHHIRQSEAAHGNPHGRETVCMHRVRQEVHAEVIHEDPHLCDTPGGYEIEITTVEPHLGEHPDEKTTPLERSLVQVNLNMEALISTSGAKVAALPAGLSCTVTSRPI